jgi:hypothetical protein
MGVSSITVDGTSASSDELLRRIGVGLGRLSTPSVILVFATGRLGKCLDDIAIGIKKRFPGVSAVVVETESVFTERGEVEGKDGFGCLIHSGRPVSIERFSTAFGPFDAGNPGAAPYGVLPVSAEQTRTNWPSLCLFSEVPPDLGYRGRVSLDSSDRGWFGAVTTSESPIWSVNHDGEVASSKAVRLEWTALREPLIVSSACCRIVSQPLTVTAIAGTTLLELDHTPALVALGQVTAKLPERSWIVIALTPDESTSTEVTVDAATSVVQRPAEAGRSPVFRPLRGIDPSRGALVLREPLEKGTRVAFAVRDDRLAKRSFDEALRRSRMQLGGATPRFGLFFEGLGRGRSLYGTGNVELSLMRQVLGSFPLLGSRSSLELSPVDGTMVMQAMSGQLALFVSPS